MTVPDGKTEGSRCNVDEIFWTDNDHTIGSRECMAENFADEDRIKSSGGSQPRNWEGASTLAAARQER